MNSGITLAIRLLCILLPGLPISEAAAQYFYKDQVVPGHTMDQMKVFRQKKIRNITLTSYENDGMLSEGFSGEQSINSNYSETVTVIKSPVTGASELRTYYNTDGFIIKTTDTTDGSGSISDYTYNAKGLLLRIINRTTSAGQAKEKDEHVWFYLPNGKPERMLRVKNDADTTVISFVLDESGNVAEENSRKKGVELPAVFYYYNPENRLTDIAGYNKKAKRILPDYVFEYDDQGKIKSMLVVPEGSDQYQKWYYMYNDNGLKIKENCFNKRKQLLGRIEYNYR